MYYTDPSKVVEVAHAIRECDIQVTISRQMTSDPNSSWVITVGENEWQRHLVFEKISDDGEAILLVLSRAQSSSFGHNVNVTDVERRTTLSELIARGYTGVRDGLHPFGLYT